MSEEGGGRLIYTLEEYCHRDQFEKNGDFEIENEIEIEIEGKE